jgi:hypothetical protein
MMTTAELRAKHCAAQFPPVPVPIPVLGETWHVAKLNAKQLDEFTDRLRAEEKAGRSGDGYLLAAVVTDEHGTRRFQDADADWLATIDPLVSVAVAHKFNEIHYPPKG